MALISLTGRLSSMAKFYRMIRETEKKPNCNNAKIIKGVGINTEASLPYIEESFRQISLKELKTAGFTKNEIGGIFNFSRELVNLCIGSKS